ncbi:MAG: LysR family transcriptional regulator [Peptostreptococcaceae bacterium]|nr:LysR family transcriptional regulator [Peptostreptococcaceae bacterium]MBP3928177.1 LysR family transcriptional regulator [Peptostreptococcaceae bacterium]
MIDELKTFIAVVDFKNFTRAGESINLSQPSVSTHIKNLESYFNTQLINRSIKQKNIVITESGYLLYKKAKEILHMIDSTKAELRSLDGHVKGHLRIGASLTIGEYLLPKFLAKFSSKYPDIEFELIIENTHNICSKIKNFTLDIGLIEGTTPSSDFNQNYFLEDKMVIACSKNSDILNGVFSIDKLQNKNWIVREEGSGTRDYINMFLTTNKIVPNNLMVLGSNYAIKEAVKNNLGITIISNYVTEPAVENNELETIELEKSYTRPFSYILPKNINTSHLTNLFIKELIEYTKK